MNANADLLSQLKIDRREPPPRRSRWWLWLLVALLAVGGIVMALALFAKRPVPAQTVEAVAIGSGRNSGSVLDATGYVVARRMATVSAKVTGRLREVRIQEGKRVAEGEVMATLDPIDADQQRTLAAAQVRAAQSQAGSLQAQLREADVQVARLTPLMQQALVSKAQYTQTVAQRDALRAQLAAVAANAQTAQAQLRIAGTGVDNTVIRAPFAGVVIAKAAQPGEIVSPFSAGGGFTRTGIGTIVDMDSLEVEVDVGEAYIGRVKPGMPVEATLNAYPDWKIPAEVIAIIPTADRAKATVKVRIKLNSSDPRIVPEMGVKVSFLEQQAANVPKRSGVRVAQSAIIRRDGKPAAFVVGAKNVVKQVAVTTGEKLGESDIQVTSGINAGDLLVDSPSDTLKTGMVIKPTEAPASE